MLTGPNRGVCRSDPNITPSGVPFTSEHKSSAIVRVYKGRKASIDPAKVRQMKADGMGPSAIAKTLRIGRASVYRALTS